MEERREIAIKRIITQIYYQGDMGAALNRLCRMVGWCDIQDGWRIPEWQQQEIEWFLNNGRKRK